MTTMRNVRTCRAGLSALGALLLFAVSPEASRAQDAPDEVPASALLASSPPPSEGSAGHTSLVVQLAGDPTDWKPLYTELQASFPIAAVSDPAVRERVDAVLAPPIIPGEPAARRSGVDQTRGQVKVGEAGIVRSQRKTPLVAIEPT
jgi:hypothetical protein